MSVLKIFVAGSLCVLAAQPGHASLVTNGGFETLPSFTGWTLSGNTTIPIAPFISTIRSEGNQGAALGGFGSPVFLSQAFSALPGATLQLSFDLANDFSLTSQFDVSLNGTNLLSLVDSPAFGFRSYSFSLTGNASGTNLLSFGFLRGSEFSYWNLDNVSVTALSTDPEPEPEQGTVPEPTSLVLAGLALAGLAATRRRRSAP